MARNQPSLSEIYAGGTLVGHDSTGYGAILGDNTNDCLNITLKDFVATTNTICAFNVTYRIR